MTSPDPSSASRWIPSAQVPDVVSEPLRAQAPINPRQALRADGLRSAGQAQAQGKPLAPKDGSRKQLPDLRDEALTDEVQLETSTASPEGASWQVASAEVAPAGSDAAVTSATPTPPPTPTPAVTLAQTPAAITGLGAQGVASTVAASGIGLGGLAMAALPVAALGAAGGNNAGTGTDLAQAQAQALALIEKFTQDSSAAAPSLQDYETAGIRGVSDGVNGNLTAINAVLTSAWNAAEAMTVSKVQAIVDAYNAIQSEANGGLADANPSVSLTAAQYAALGVAIGAAASDPHNLALLNDSVAAQLASGVDTVAELQDLARIANAVQTLVAGGSLSSALSAADLTRLGLANVTSDNLAAVIAALGKQADDGSQTQSLNSLQTLVNTVTQDLARITNLPTVAMNAITDNMGGRTGTVASGNRTDDTSLVLSGTLGGSAAGASLAAGETVRIYDGNTFLGNATVTVVAGGQSTWSFTDTRTLTHTQTVRYTARVADAALNEGTPTAAYTVTIDTLSETISDDAPPPGSNVAVTAITDNVGTITGTVASGNRTDDTSLVLSGTLGGSTAGTSLATGETLRIQDGNTVLGNATVTVVAGGQSTWSYTDSRTLTHGQTVSYTARLVDAAMNQGTPSAAYTATIDTTAPVAPGLSLATDSGTSNSDGLTNVATINVSGLEAGASWQYRVGSGSWTAGTGTSFAATAGSNTYTVRQTDTAGNLGAASAALTVDLDTTAPVAPGLSLATDSGTSNSDGLTNVATVNVSGLEAGASWQYRVGSGSWTAGTGTSFAATAGSNTYAVRQTDTAGNLGAASAALTVDLDTTAPAAPGLSLATDSGTSSSDGISNVATVNVSGLEAGATWEYQVGGGGWTAGTGASFTATAGSNTYTVRQTDLAGNLGTASSAVTYNLDSTGPTVSGVEITGATGRQHNRLNVGDVVGVTVTMSEATTVTGTPTLGLNIGGTTVQASYASGSGTNALVFNYTILAAQTDANGISVDLNSLALAGGTLKDAAGNDATLTHSAVADNAIFIVDTTEPAAPSLSLATDSGTSNSDGLTNVATINVSGLEPGATWEYRVGSGSWTAGTGTSFAATAGSNTYAVRQTDLAGNLGTASSAVTYNYDATGPTVSSVAITSATGIQNNRLNVGDVVSVTVTMSEATTVTGTPTLGLNIGGTTVQASYASGSGTNALVFNYTILAAQTDADGISVDLNSLALAGGTLKDAAGNNATLTHSAVADNASFMVDTTAPTPTIAPVSKALTMRWTEQQYAQMPTLALGELGGDLTLQAWVYIGGTQWNHARILDFGNAAANNNLWLGFFGGKLRFEAFNNATSLINLTAPDTFAVTQWNHVAVTVTSAQVVTLYINGNAVATGVASQAINAATRNLNYLGKSNWPDPYYDGRLADVRVYNDARTPAEILADMAGGTPGDNLVMGYSFDGSTAAMSGASKTTSATLLSNNGSPTAHTEGAFEPLTFSADSGPSQKDFITNTATQTLSGKYSAALASDEDVYVSLNNASSWILAQKDNNTLTWTLANAVLNAGADGTNTVRVKVMDAAGNNNLVYTDANIQYTLDTAAPAAPSLSLATDSGTSNSDSLTNVATVNVTGLVAGASWQYQVGGGSWTAGTGTSFAATAGSNTYAVRQTDLAGNLGAASSAVTYNYDATGPTVSSVAITSATGIQNNRLNVGDVVGVTVTMSEATTVTGTPTLGLKIGGTTVQASYASGSGTNALVFNYTILAAQTDADGISVDLNSLALAGGTLKDAAGNNATLTHSAVADNASFLVDTTAPAAPSLSLATDSGTSNSDSLTNVATVNVSGLEAGATWEYQVGSGSWTAGTGTSFTATAGSNTYAVRQTDAAGNLGTASSAVTYNYDANGPTVSGVAITGATGRQNNTLNAGDVVSVTVTMNEATTVSGTPTLGLNIGGTTVQASYASGSGTTALMFN